MISMETDPAKCTKCGLCVKICPTGIVTFGDSGLPEISPASSLKCIRCGHCALFCPESANSLSFLRSEDMLPASELKLPSVEEALDLIKSRRSIRRFKEDSLAPETFNKIFEAASMAPTASNSQQVRWVVSADREKTKAIADLILCWMREAIFKDPTSRIALVGASMIAKAKAGEDGLLRGAPHIAAAILPKEYGWPEDGTIALTYLELSAHSLGIGTCWGGFLTSAVRSFSGLRDHLGIKEDEHMCGALMLGHPEYLPARQFPPRKKSNIAFV